MSEKSQQEAVTVVAQLLNGVVAEMQDIAGIKHQGREVGNTPHEDTIIIAEVLNWLSNGITIKKTTREFKAFLENLQPAIFRKYNARPQKDRIFIPKALDLFEIISNTIYSVLDNSRPIEGMDERLRSTFLELLKENGGKYTREYLMHSIRKMLNQYMALFRSLNEDKLRLEKNGIKDLDVYMEA